MVTVDDDARKKRKQKYITHASEFVQVAIQCMMQYTSTSMNAQLAECAELITTT